jgi:hypothetical protein
MTDSRHHAESARAALIADQLGLGRTLDRWSMVFTLLTGAGLLMAAQGHAGKSMVVFGIGTLSAAMQKYFALRTQLDAAIFQRWTKDWRDSVMGTPETDMHALDIALGKDTTVCRSLSDRSRGAKNLLLRQSVCFIVQLLCFLSGAWLLG